MKEIVRPGGRIVIVVPHEVNVSVNRDDINTHLFTWPGSKYLELQKLFGWKNFQGLQTV